MRKRNSFSRYDRKSGQNQMSLTVITSQGAIETMLHKRFTKEDERPLIEAVQLTLKEIEPEPRDDFEDITEKLAIADAFMKQLDSARMIYKNEERNLEYIVAQVCGYGSLFELHSNWKELERLSLRFQRKKFLANPRFNALVEQKQREIIERAAQEAVAFRFDEGLKLKSGEGNG